MKSPSPIALPEGVFLAHFSKRGLARLDWPEEKERKAESRKQKSALAPTAVVPAELPRWLQQTRAALEMVMAGKSPRELPPLDLSAGTSFQQQVWHCLRKIRPGQTRTYAELAAAIGRPRAARAVGNACGANPIPLLIPCHRVLPSSGGLGGFSGPVQWKRSLLEREGRQDRRVAGPTSASPFRRTARP